MSSRANCTLSRVTSPNAASRNRLIDHRKSWTNLSCLQQQQGKKKKFKKKFTRKPLATSIHITRFKNLQVNTNKYIKLSSLSCAHDPIPQNISVSYRPDITHVINSSPCCRNTHVEQPRSEKTQKRNHPYSFVPLAPRTLPSATEGNIRDHPALLRPCSRTTFLPSSGVMKKILPTTHYFFYEESPLHSFTSISSSRRDIL